MRGKYRKALACAAAALLTACAQQDPDWANKLAMTVGAPRANAAQIRERQTTRFPNVPEERLLVEATQALQDLGFTIEESAPKYGVLGAGKDRDATEAGQVAGQIALAIGFALLGASYNPVWDTDQVIRATITTRPEGARDTAMRVSFERIVTNTKGLSRIEQLTAPEFSSGFFEKVRSGLARGA